MQSLCLQKKGRRTKTLEELRLQVYVDDPLAVARGTPQRRERLFTMLTLAWQVLGFPMALHKAQWGQRVDWIGIQLIWSNSSVVATVAEEKIAELTVLTNKILSKNVVANDELRTYCGKVQSLANLLFALRPFVGELWAALHSASEGAPRNYTWTKQCRMSLLWLLIFYKQSSQGPLRRTFYS